MFNSKDEGLALELGDELRRMNRIFGNHIPVLRPKETAGDFVKNRDGMNQFLVSIKKLVITEGWASR